MRIITLLLLICFSKANAQDTLADIQFISVEDTLSEIQMIQTNDSTYLVERTSDCTGLAIQCLLPIEEPFLFPSGVDSLFCTLEKDWNTEVIASIESNGVVFVRFEIDSSGTMHNLHVNPSYIKRESVIRDSILENEVTKAFEQVEGWSSFKKSERMDCTLILRFPYIMRCKS